MHTPDALDAMAAGTHECSPVDDLDPGNRTRNVRKDLVERGDASWVAALGHPVVGVPRSVARHLEQVNGPAVGGQRSERGPQRERDEIRPCGGTEPNDAECRL